MLRTYKSELIRFRRTAVVGAGIMAAFAALVTMLTFIGFEGGGPGGGSGGPGGGPPNIVTDLASVDGLLAGLAAASTMLGIVALALFAMSVAKDYERGTIRQLLVGEPRRGLLLGGKVLALVTVTVVGVLASALVAAGTAFAFSGSAGISTAAWTTSAAFSASIATVTNVAVATIVWGLSGAVLAMLTKSSSAAITTGVAYLLIGENLLTLVWDTATNWLPSGTLSTFSAGGTGAVSYGQSGLLLLGYAALFAATTFAVFWRRDVTD